MSLKNTEGYNAGEHKEAQVTGYLKAGFAILLLIFCTLCLIASLQQVPTAIDHWRQNDKSGAITTWVILIVSAWAMNASWRWNKRLWNEEGGPRRVMNKLFGKRLASDGKGGE